MKKMMLVLIGLLFICQAAFAKTAIVDGVGADRDTALRDAMRNAVEEVVGIYIDAETITAQYEVVQDEIYVESPGFVRNITVLDEYAADGVYTVRARVDVDTDPNTELMDRIHMINVLEDPRIGVIVFKRDAIESSYYRELEYDMITETAVNERLLDLGFRHVADAALTAKLRDSALLNSIYRGDAELVADTKHYGLDILILAESTVDANEIVLHRSGGIDAHTQLIRGDADITGKVILFGTGYIKGVFHLTGQGIDITEFKAENKALLTIAEKAAQEVEQILRGEAAKPFCGVQITASVSDDAMLSRLVEEIEGIPGVQNVRLREQQGGEAVIDLETTLKPHNILRLLKEKSEFGIFNDGISGNRLAITVTA